MKFKRIIFLLLIGFFAFSFISCNTNTDKNSNKFYFSSLNTTKDGNVVEYKVGDTYGDIKLTKDYYVITLNSDKTYKVECNGKEESKGTWKNDKGYEFISSNGDKFEANIEKGIFSISKEINGIKSELFLSNK